MSCGLGDKAFDCLPAAALVAVAEMGPFAVVVVEPGIQIGLQGVDVLVEPDPNGRERTRRGAIWPGQR
jgi:hypothetical protein